MGIGQRPLENLDVNQAMWKNRRVLVTGATGLLGGWTVKRLLELGAEPVLLVRDQVPGAVVRSNGALERSRVVRGDVTDQPVVERAINEYEVTTVLHLAAQTIVGIANRNPISTFETNIRGTWTVLEACRRCPGVAQIVVASSDKAYGDQVVLPYGEDTPLQGRHPYDVSKSCTDLIAQSYAITYRLPVMITRCGNLYGGGDLNWNRLVPGTIRSLLSGERPVIRSDGLFIRDYVYVEDAVGAVLTLAQAAAEDPAIHGQAFNFSNELKLTVLDMVRAIARQMGSSLEPRILNEASHEIREQYLSARKARAVLNWRPAFTLEAALARTIDWYREHLRHD